jgi:hypothetical protein
MSGPGRKRIDIEELLVWAFMRQKAHLIVPRGAGLYGQEAQAEGLHIQARSADGCATILDRTLLGTQIDYSGRDPGNCPADAETCYYALSLLSGEAASIVLRHARQAARPDWGEGLQPRMVPVWRKGPRYESGLPAKGSFKLIYSKARHAIGCKVQAVHTADLAAAYRRDWSLWLGALEHLVRHFQDHPLERFIVVGPAAPAEPWAR